MADPISIIGLIASIGSVADIVVRSIEKFSQFRTKYREAPFIIAVLLGQLCTIRTALHQLREWSERHIWSDPRYTELARGVKDALACFNPLMAHLQKQLDIHESEENAKIPLKQRTSFVWKERELSNYFQMLDCQVNALTLLFQAVQCKTWTDQRLFLSTPDSKVILHSAKDCSSSVLAVKDGASSHGRDSRHDDVDIVGRKFEFDDALMHSKVYCTAYRSHLKKIMIENRQHPESHRKRKTSSIAESAVVNGRAGKQPVQSINAEAASSIELTVFKMPSPTHLDQLSRYVFMGKNYVRKKDPITNRTTPGYPVGFANRIDIDLEFAIMHCSTIRAASVRDSARSPITSSPIDHDIQLLTDTPLVAGMGYVAEEFDFYHNIAGGMILQRNFPRKGSLPGYLHLELYIYKGILEGRVVNVSVQLVDGTDYSTDAPCQDTSFIVVCNSVTDGVGAFVVARGEQGGDGGVDIVVGPPLPDQGGEDDKSKGKEVIGSKRHSDSFAQRMVSRARWSLGRSVTSSEAPS